MFSKSLVDLDPEADSPEGKQLEVLGTLVQAYETQHYPIDPPGPIDAIKFRMEQSGSFDGSTSAEQDGLSVAIGKAALDNPELPMQLVRDIMVSLEEVKSGQVLTPYKRGGGH